MRFAESVRALPNIEVEGLFTHFAAAEEGDKRFTRMQYDALLEASKRLPWIPMRHCSASASLLLDPDMALDAVRAGLGIYGYEPAPDCGDVIELRRVLSLKSRVARLIDVEPGATVGYGRAWRAERPSTHRAGDVRLRRRAAARALEPGARARARPPRADRGPHRDGHVHGRRDGRARRCAGR